jgi:iron(III) transport system substrate-binding protein
VPNSDVLNKSVGDAGAKNPPVGFGTYSDRRDNEKEGWALQVANNVEPSNGILFPAVLTIADKAPHPAAARLLIDFMFGDDTPTGGRASSPSTCRATMRCAPRRPPRFRQARRAEGLDDRSGEDGGCARRIADLIITLQ